MQSNKPGKDSDLKSNIKISNFYITFAFCAIGVISSLLPNKALALPNGSACSTYTDCDSGYCDPGYRVCARVNIPIYGAGTADSSQPKFTIPTPKITISDKMKFEEPAQCGSGENGAKYYCFSWIGQYVQGVYNYAISIVGIVAALAMVIGGFIWLTAGGNPSKVGEAKNWIGSSLMGLLLALGSYLIMTKISPNLVNFKPIRVAYIEPKDYSYLLKDSISGGAASVNTASCYAASQRDCEGVGNGYMSVGQDTGSCKASEHPELGGDNSTTVCCCATDPQPGCSWGDICNPAEQMGDANTYNCGTNWGGPKNCCCRTSGSGVGTNCGNNWTYANNAQNQCSGNTASSDLKNLLDCLKQEGISSSIYSVTGGGVSSAADIRAVCNGTYGGSYGRTDPNTCHFGRCRGDYLSHAVDLSTSNQAQACAIVDAAQRCKDRYSGADIDVITEYGCTSNSVYRYDNNNNNWGDHRGHAHLSINCSGY